MARYCSKCSKKFGFFEEGFDGMCKNCYDKKLEEERIRIQREQEEKEREERRRIEEQKRKEEERKRIEEEQRRIEEERKRIEEEQRREEEQRKIEKERMEKELLEKTKYIKDIMLKYTRFAVVSGNAIYNMNLSIEISEKDIICKLIEHTISTLPLNPTYRDIEKINTRKYLKKLIAILHNEKL